MKLLYKIICTALAPVLLISCSEKIEQPDVSCGGHAYKSVFKWGKPTDIFGFQPQNRYAYCPSVIEMEDGSCHMFFCGNPEENKKEYSSYLSADKSALYGINIKNPPRPCGFGGFLMF